MDCQQEVEASNNIIAIPDPLTIHVMVVDDDAISLAVLSNLLKTLNYQGKSKTKTEILLGFKFPSSCFVFLYFCLAMFF